MNENNRTISSERDESAALWCMRLADAPLDAGEQAAFDRWLAADSHNARAFEEAVAVWNGIDTITHTPEMIRHRAEAVESLRDLNARRWSRGNTMRWCRPAAFAACFVLFLLAAIALLYDHPARYQTGIGERRVVLLEDGSRLTLDAATTVKVWLDDKQRSLELVSGRAKFDVAHDPWRPFSVRAGNRVTIALGTTFSVELLSKQVRVVLYEGRVEVIDQPDENTRLVSLLTAPERSPDAKPVAAPSEAAVVLNPGSELIAAADGPAARVITADLTRSLSWESGLLSFEGEPLMLAAERMNRYAKDRIVIGDRRAASYSISGVFAAGDAAAFVEGVTTLYPLDVRLQPGEMVLASR